MFIIGIAGGTGSGKTTMVQQIMNSFSPSEVCLLTQDDYYKISKLDCLEDRAKTNFDHPDAIDFELLLDQITRLKEGQTIEQPIYSFTNHNRTNNTQTIHPAKVLIVEGILILTQETLRQEFDLTLFIEADTDVRLIRRIERDCESRSRDLKEIIDRYQSTLKPMHEQFIETTRIHANIIIPNNQPNHQAVNVIKAIIKQQIE